MQVCMLLSFEIMETIVLILTPLPLEYKAVVQHLTGASRTFIRDGAAYEEGYFEGEHHHYKVVVSETGMSNADMSLASERAIQQVQPHLVLLVGIAAGIKDVRIGDVLVAKKVYSYDSGKEDVDGFKARPAVESFSRELLANAQVLSRSEEWKKRCSDGAPAAKVFIGPIAAGDKVVASTDNETYRRIKTHYNDTLGLEMEASGFGLTIQMHRRIHGLVVRGISDMCEGKAETDQQNWQPVAAERAAAFAFELLYGLHLTEDALGAVARTEDKKPVAPDHLAHPLKKYPAGPMVEAHLIGAVLVQQYAKLIRQEEALQVIAAANAFRLEADPNASVIREYQLKPVATVTPYAFWLDVFKEARMHGPRMVAALLLVFPDELFDAKARENRQNLLDKALK